MSTTTTSRSPSPSVESDEAYSGYDDCIHEDLTSRVFVDFEVFIKRFLHAPDDWKTLWGPAIDAVKVDSAFNKTPQTLPFPQLHVQATDKFCAPGLADED